MKKRILSMFLAIVMVVGLVPGFSLTAFAAVGDVEAKWGADADNLTGSGTLEAAIAAATAEDSTVKYIQLQRDVASGFVIRSGAFTIDLNGKKVSSDEYTFDIAGAGTEITFVSADDSVGRVSSNAENSSAIVVSSEASVIILGGEYEGKNDSVIVNADTSVTILGGTFKGTDGEAVSSKGTLIIKGGSFDAGAGSGMIQYSGGVLDLSDYSGVKDISVYIDTEAAVTPGDDTIKLPDGYCFYDEDDTAVASLAVGHTYTIGEGQPGGDASIYTPVLLECAGGDADVTPDECIQGDTVTITPKPNAGYEVDEVIVTDENDNRVAVIANGDGTYSFTQPAASVFIEVTFKSTKSDFANNMWQSSLRMLFNQKFDIAASVTNGGTITTSGDSQVKYDKNITYTFTPDEGYEISAVLVNGEDIGAVSEYTFNRVKEDQTIEVIFTKIKQQNPFTDVSENDWFYEDVQYVYENGLMLGTDPEGTVFSPDEPLTRTMLVTLLWRLEGEPAVNDAMQFEDVAEGEWYTEAVRWAASEGIVLGYNGEFNPADALSREQAAAILHRYAVLKGWDNGIALPMIPQYSYSLWAENDVIWADMVGLTNGLGVDSFDMTAYADRAEIAAYLSRFCEAFGE